MALHGIHWIQHVTQTLALHLLQNFEPAMQFDHGMAEVQPWLDDALEQLEQLPLPPSLFLARVARSRVFRTRAFISSFLGYHHSETFAAFSILWAVVVLSDMLLALCRRLRCRIRMKPCKVLVIWSSDITAKDPLSPSRKAISSLYQSSLSSAMISWCFFASFRTPRWRSGMSLRKRSKECLTSSAICPSRSMVIHAAAAAVLERHNLMILLAKRTFHTATFNFLRRERRYFLRRTA